MRKARAAVVEYSANGGSRFPVEPFPHFFQLVQLAHVQPVRLAHGVGAHAAALAPLPLDNVRTRYSPVLVRNWNAGFSRMAVMTPPSPVSTTP